MSEAKHIDKCPICLNITKLEGHHVVPKEFGGPENGPMILLCSSCHHNCHYQAENDYKGKTKVYFPPDQMERAKPVIFEILRAKQLYETRRDTEVKQLRRVIVNVPDKTLKNLHRLKADKGFKSLDKFLNQVFESITSVYRE